MALLERVLLSTTALGFGVLFMATFDEAKSVVAKASPNPRAVVERSTLSSSAMDLGNTINTGSGARGRHEVTVEGAMNIPGVAQSRHDGRFLWLLLCDNGEDGFLGSSVPEEGKDLGALKSS